MGKNIIDLKLVWQTIWHKKKLFFKVVPVVMVLAAAWIFPQPRYYRAEISLAPEAGGADIGGGLASLASSFGFNIGGIASSDAIYPLLYPELFESPQFKVSLLSIQIETADDSYKGDYYTYLKKHQKKNPLTAPFKKLKKSIVEFFKPKTKGVGNPAAINAFRMTEEDFELVEGLSDKITCKNDKKTDVTTILVEAQDPLVCALLADSICSRLQDFIVAYRTSKARMDVAFYQQLSDSAYTQYLAASAIYSAYADANKNASRQAILSKKNELETEMNLRQNTWQAYLAQLDVMKSKVQERTPAFTVLRTPTVPIKPAGPKRVLFILGMGILATLMTGLWTVRKIIFA